MKMNNFSTNTYTEMKQFALVYREWFTVKFLFYVNIWRGTKMEFIK